MPATWQAASASLIAYAKHLYRMVLNEPLAGLVGITAGTDTVNVNSAIIIGFILVCGTWGTLGIGIFSANPKHSFLIQLIGVLAFGVSCFAAAFAISLAIKTTLRLRVNKEEKRLGLDVSKHGTHTRCHTTRYWPSQNGSSVSSSCDPGRPFKLDFRPHERLVKCAVREGWERSHRFGRRIVTHGPRRH